MQTTTTETLYKVIDVNTGKVLKTNLDFYAGRAFMGDRDDVTMTETTTDVKDALQRRANLIEVQEADEEPKAPTKHYYAKEIADRLIAVGTQRAALKEVYGDFATLNAYRGNERQAVRRLADDLKAEYEELIAAINENRIIKR